MKKITFYVMAGFHRIYFYYCALFPVRTRHISKIKKLVKKPKRRVFYFLFRTLLYFLLANQLIKFYLKVGKLEHTLNRRFKILDIFEEYLPSPTLHPYLPLVLQNQLIEKAKFELNQGNNREAFRLLDEAISKYPFVSSPFLLKGLAAFNLKMYEEAIHNLDLAISIDSSLNMAYALKGEAFHLLFRFKEAIKCYDTSLNLKEEARNYFLRGNTYTSLNSVENAISDYRKALQLDSNNIEYLTATARAYIYLKRFDEAEDCINQIKKLKPKEKIKNEEGLTDLQELIHIFKQKKVRSTKPITNIEIIQTKH